MTSTYTDNLRITKQGDGDNSTTWGQVVNNQIIELFEDAISGVVEIDCTGSSNVNISSTTVNGGTDDARHMILELTGTLGASIQLLLPAVDKLYAIRASFSGGYTINVRPTGGGSGIDFTNGQVGLIYTNGTSVYAVSPTNALLASNNLSDLINAATARTNLGLGTAAVLNVGTSANQVVQLDGTGKLPAVDGSQLTGIDAGGTMASQDADNVAITGGTITGITDLAIADGGTGASTAAAARTNLGLNSLVASAWINFNGATNAIRKSSNVSSITDNGTGDYTINFTTALADANYAAVITTNVYPSAGQGVYADIISQTTSALRISIQRGTTTYVDYDATTICVIVFD